MSYNLADDLTSYQKQVIRKIIKKQEIKNAKSKHPDIYENYIDEPEFWDELATQIATNLFQDSSNYYGSYELQSKGNLDGKGFRIELLDSSNEEKYYIDYMGKVYGPSEYTPSAHREWGLNGTETMIVIGAILFAIIGCGILFAAKSFSLIVIYAIIGSVYAVGVSFYSALKSTI